MHEYTTLLVEKLQASIDQLRQDKAQLEAEVERLKQQILIEKANAEHYAGRVLELEQKENKS